MRRLFLSYKNYSMKFLWVIIMVTFSAGYTKSQVMFGNVDNNKVLNFHSNYITFSKPIELIILGKKRKSFPTPLTINGRTIYSTSNPSTKAPKFKGDFSEYVFNAIKNELELLPDGAYTVNRLFLVIDKAGVLSYFDFDTLKIIDANNIRTVNNNFIADGERPIYDVQDAIDQMGLKEAPANSRTLAEPEISKEIKLKIYYSLYKALKFCPKFKPATHNGNPVDFRYGLFEYGSDDVFIIKKHKASLFKISELPKK